MKNSAILVSILAVVLAIGLGVTGCTATLPSIITQTQTITSPTITVTQTPVTVTTTKTVTMATTTPATAAPSPVAPFDQVLTSTIKPGVTITDYVKYLRAGDQVTGVVQLTGLGGEDDYSWIFTIFYRGNNDDVKSFFQNWQDGNKWQNKHAFGFTVQKEGEYTLRITNDSRTNKDLRIDISPTGWK